MHRIPVIMLISYSDFVRSNRLQPPLLPPPPPSDCSLAHLAPRRRPRTRWMKTNHPNTFKFTQIKFHSIEFLEEKFGKMDIENPGKHSVKLLGTQQKKWIKKFFYFLWLLKRFGYIAAKLMNLRNKLTNFYFFFLPIISIFSFSLTHHVLAQLRLAVGPSTLIPIVAEATLLIESA